MTINITSQNFEEEVSNSKTPVIIDVYATWCGPCQNIIPIFNELEKELNTKYKFAKINIDEERDLAIKYNISSIPTFLFIKNGTVVGTEVGYMNKEDLLSKIEELLG